MLEEVSCRTRQLDSLRPINFHTISASRRRHRCRPTPGAGQTTLACCCYFLRQHVLSSIISGCRCRRDGWLTSGADRINRSSRNRKQCHPGTESRISCGRASFEGFMGAGCWWLHNSEFCLHGFWRRPSDGRIIMAAGPKAVQINYYLSRNMNCYGVILAYDGWGPSLEPLDKLKLTRDWSRFERWRAPAIHWVARNRGPIGPWQLRQFSP